MTQEDCRAWVSSLIEENRIHEFYVSKEFRRLRKKILEKYKHRCVLCRERGKLTKANVVHHVRHVKKFPELALSEVFFDKDGEHDNLIAVCKECHETVCHPERLKYKQTEPLTEEMW